MIECTMGLSGALNGASLGALKWCRLGSLRMPIKDSAT